MKLHITESDDFSISALGTLLSDDFTLTDGVQSAEVLWVRLNNYIDSSWMGPNLRCIVTATTGLNHIDLAACEKRGITVLSLKGETDFLQTIRATAEHTILLMLALLRHLPLSVESVKRGEWNRERFKGRELADATVAIIGSSGRVGRQVYGILREGFGCETCSIEQQWSRTPSDGKLHQLALDQVDIADIVTLHANWTPENDKMCDAKFFAAMKPGALFINTARGELVNEEALIDALDSGHLGGAALDVLDGEQHPSLDFVPETTKAIMYGVARRLDNLIITPHLGGCTHESMEKTEVFMAGKLLEWAKAQGACRELGRDVIETEAAKLGLREGKSCEHRAITRERLEGGIKEVCCDCGMSWNLTMGGRLWTEEPKEAAL